MSDTSPNTYRDKFGDNLAEFCGILSFHFPDVEQFVIAKTLIQPVCLVNSDFLVPIMQRAHDVREMIFSRNEAFFTDNANNLFDFEPNSEFGDHVNALKDLWLGDRITPDMRDTMWTWLTVLAKFCQRYFEKINQ
jgi:hypothetical protein